MIAYLKQLNDIPESCTLIKTNPVFSTEESFIALKDSASDYLKTIKDKNRGTEIYDHRFFKIISAEETRRSIRFPTSLLMMNNAKRILETHTNGLGVGKDEVIIGDIIYRLYNGIYTQGIPTVFIIKMLMPNITDFFKSCQNNKYFDLSNLIGSIDLLSELERIFYLESKESSKEIFYREFPEFAVFYYEVYPYVKLDILNSYNVNKLLEAKKLTKELGLDTSQFNELFDELEHAKNNTKILTLIRNN